MEEYETLIIKDDLHFNSAFRLLNDFRENGEFCDVIISTDDGVKVSAHRVVLSSCSPYFRAMFTADFLEAREAKVELKCVDGHALKDIIDYFYTSELHVNYFNVEGVVNLANVLQIEDVAEKCEVFLRRNMSPKNSLGFLAFAEQYSMLNLQQHAMRYCCWYFDFIKEEDEFLHLPKQGLLHLIKQDTLRAPSEEYIFEAVMKWLHFDFYNRKDTISQILPLIRFPLMNMNYLYESDLIKLLKANFSLGQFYINEALQFQKRNISYDDMVLPKQCTPRASSEDIYVIGGWSNGQKLSTVQCFSVDTLKWQTVSNMTVAHVSREDYFRVIVSNEELYTICQDRVMKYDPVECSWQKFASGPEIQCKWAGVCEHDSNFYVIGGNSMKVSKCFNIESGEWREMPEMNQAR